MARLSSPVWENHRPGNVCYPSVQFAINKISDPPKAQADRHGNARKVCNIPEVPALLVARNPRGNEDTDESAVKRHAALPDRENG